MSVLRSIDDAPIEDFRGNIINKCHFEYLHHSLYLSPCISDIISLPEIIFNEESEPVYVCTRILRTFTLTHTHVFIWDQECFKCVMVKHIWFRAFTVLCVDPSNVISLSSKVLILGKEIVALGVGNMLMNFGVEANCLHIQSLFSLSGPRGIRSASLLSDGKRAAGKIQALGTISLTLKCINTRSVCSHDFC